ncbi:MAG: hypothetical protein ACOCUR_02730 [Nanoarchaeota archaeon]
MPDEEYLEDPIQEDAEVQMDNDEISPEEEGFMKGYEDEENYDKDFDSNSDSE